VAAFGPQGPGEKGAKGSNCRPDVHSEGGCLLTSFRPPLTSSSHFLGCCLGVLCCGVQVDDEFEQDIMAAMW